MNKKLKALQARVLKENGKPVHQKFSVGDPVNVTITDPNRSHFSGKGRQAVVCGSYYQRYGGGQQNKKLYTLAFVGGGRSSWYLEEELSLVQD